MSVLPVFRFRSDGQLVLKATDRADLVAQAVKRQKSGGFFKHMLTKEEVQKKAKLLLASEKIHPTENAVLSRSTLQFGRYRGKTFIWLLQNDIGWAVSLLADHIRLSVNRAPSTVPDLLHDNKEALLKYAYLCPEMKEAVDERVQMNKMKAQLPRPSSAEGDVMIGFGPFPKMTRAQLFHSSKGDHRDYVASVLHHPINRPGGGLDRLQRYFQKMQSEETELVSSVEELEKKRVHTPKKKASATITKPTDISLTGDIVLEKKGVRTSKKTALATITKPTDISLTGDIDLELTEPLTSTLQSQPTYDKAEIPRSWKEFLPEEEVEWIGRTLFRMSPATGKSEIAPNLRLWYYPPEPPRQFNQPPASPRSFFLIPLVFWAPMLLWNFSFQCLDECVAKIASSGRKPIYLTMAGFHQTVRKVLDVDGWYHLTTQRLECLACKKRFLGWSSHILNQLDASRHALFPALLTYRYACDMKVVKLLRERTLGNSATKLQKQLQEQHAEKHLQRSLLYLQSRAPFHTQSVFDMPAPMKPIPEMPVIPKYQWFLNIFVRDALTRLDDTKAKITSNFGSVLKMDSTKKVVKKLAGKAAGTASWSTNVGNEYGVVLMSVLTDSEGEGLEDMIAGLIKRYSDAEEAPPKLLYVDRECCCLSGESRLERMIRHWPELVIRLDIWHFMRRFTVAVTSEAHALYGLFMSRLSSCIFEWDPEDYAALEDTIQTDLGLQGMWSIQRETIEQKISKKDLQRHCRRRTRGTEETTRLIQELIDTFDSDSGKDTIGVPLLDHDRIQQVWLEQKRHVACIQDPSDVALYTQTGTKKKGVKELPVYRCARGSTSLESFHLHLNRFIPGYSASDVHWQAYLLEGMVRWNDDRILASTAEAGPSQHVYNLALCHAVNQFHQQVYGKPYDISYPQPRRYTGEKIGIEYLYGQTGKIWQPVDMNADSDDLPDIVSDEAEEDEGFEEEIVDPTIAFPVADVAVMPSGPVASPEKSTPAEEGSIGPGGLLGWDTIQDLASSLFHLHDLTSISTPMADEIIRTWKKLPPSLQASRVQYQPRFRSDKEHVGRFMRSKPTSTVTSSSAVQGVQSLKRAMVGGNSGPATSVDASPLVEALCVLLESAYTSPIQQHKKTTSRWKRVLDSYHHIRSMVINHDKIMSTTNIQLYELNQTSLLTWWNRRQKTMEKKVLSQAIPNVSAPATSSQPQFAPKKLPMKKPVPPANVQQQIPIIRPATIDRRKQQPSPLPTFLAPTSQQYARPQFNRPQFNSPRPIAIPKSTLFNQRKRAAEESEGEAIPKKKYNRANTFNVCSHCQNPKTKDFHHSRHSGLLGVDTYCPSVQGADGTTKEQWLAARKLVNPPKPRMPKKPA